MPGRMTAVLLAALAAAISASCASPVARIIEEGRERSQVMSHLDHLVNTIGPRLTGSTRQADACRWTRDTFEGFGLTNCRVEEWGTFPVGFDRGPWSGRMVAPEDRPLTCGTMAWTAGTPGPVTGPARLLPAGAEEAAAQAASLKGAWIVIEKREKGHDPIMAACEKAGAAGFVRGSRAELILTGGDHAIRADDLPKRVTAHLTRADHQAILGHLKEGREVTLRFDFQNRFVTGPVSLTNVIADLPGRGKPDEFVIVGGHIDSWDGATGTTDNGTGVATTLEAARLLARSGASPRRTIRFMLWSGEEQGLMGSRAWIKAHPKLLPKISAVLVHDGGTNYVSGISASASLVPLFEPVFAPVMELDPAMKFKIARVTSLPRGIGSDHDSFLAAGVPGFFWHQAGRANYTTTHHTQHDLYQAAIPEYQQHSAVVIALAALGIADLPDLLPRDGVKAGDRGRRRMLGISLEDDLVVSSIRDGTIAEKAGLREGDRLVRVGDRKPESVDHFRTLLQESPKQTTVTVARDGQEITIPVTFTD